MVNIVNGHETPAPTTPIDRPEPETAHRRLHTAGPDTALSGTGPAATATRYLLAGIRLALGWIFLWAVLDKLFGLGHSTVAAKSWLNGGSPTAGFLGKSTTGPFTGFYHSIAGNTIADALFMAALLGIGTTLGLGAGGRPPRWYDTTPGSASPARAPGAPWPGPRTIRLRPEQLPPPPAHEKAR